LRRRRRLVLGAAGPGEGEQVAALSVVEAQGSSDGVQHRVGGVGVPAALEADVVVHAHPGQLRDLLPPQAWHPASPGVGRQSGCFRGQPRAAGAQEVAQFGLAPELSGGAPGRRLRAHGSRVGPAGGLRVGGLADPGYARTGGKTGPLTRVRRLIACVWLVVRGVARGGQRLPGLGPPTTISASAPAPGRSHPGRGEPKGYPDGNHACYRNDREADRQRDHVLGAAGQPGDAARCAT